MAKDVVTLISILAVGALFVIFFVPGVASERLERAAALLFAMGMTALTLFRWHLRTINRVSSQAGRIAVLAGPAAMMVLMWFAPRSRADWIDVIASTVGAYLFGVAIVAGIVWLTHRG